MISDYIAKGYSSVISPALFIMIALIIGFICLIKMAKDADDIELIEQNKSEFLKEIEVVKSTDIKARYPTGIFPPIQSLATIGVNGLIVEKNGVYVFSYGLEYFDGPTRVLIYDPDNKLQGDYTQYHSRKKPLRIVKMDAWTYIKRDD